MMRVLARPVWRVVAARRLAVSARLLAPKSAAPSSLSAQGPLHEGVSTTQPRKTSSTRTKKAAAAPKRKKKKAKKASTRKPGRPKKRKAAAKPLTVTTQLARAKKALSPEAKRAYEATSPSALALFVRNYVANNPGGPATERLGQASSQWKSLAQNEKARFEQQSEQARREKERLLSSLSETDAAAAHHVQRLENSARRARTARDGKPRDMDRRTFGAHTKKPPSAYAQFVQQHAKDAEVAQLTAQDRFKRIAQMWQEQK